MKLAHNVIATPGKCGLYETARELVAAERAQGVDARIVDPDPNPKYHPGKSDRGVPVEHISWATQADVLIDHSGMEGPGTINLDKPIIEVLHGRPASTFWGERNGKAPGLSYALRRNTDPRFKAVVTFWPEHVPYHEGLWGDIPVHAVPPSVDLNAWCPGPTGYDFKGMGGSPNVIVTDMWRDDVDPFTCLAAFVKFTESQPKARLHLYGLPDNKKGIDAYRRVLMDKGNMGVAEGHVSKGLVAVYRAADLLISPHKIYTRAIREAMACGVPVVSGQEVDPLYINNFADAMDVQYQVGSPSHVRQQAERLFDPEQTAKKFLEVVNGYCGQCLANRNVV